MSTRERFAAWVEERVRGGATRTAISAEIGCHPSQLPRFIAGTRHPDLRVAIAIEDATAGWAEGQILAREWAAERSLAPTGT